VAKKRLQAPESSVPPNVPLVQAQHPPVQAASPIIELPMTPVPGRPNQIPLSITSLMQAKIPIPF